MVAVLCARAIEPPQREKRQNAQGQLRLYSCSDVTDHLNVISCSDIILNVTRRYGVVQVWVGGQESARIFDAVHQ